MVEKKDDPSIKTSSIPSLPTPSTNFSSAHPNSHSYYIFLLVLGKSLFFSFLWYLIHLLSSESSDPDNPLMCRSTPPSSPQTLINLFGFTFSGQDSVQSQHHFPFIGKREEGGSLQVYKTRIALFTIRFWPHCFCFCTYNFKIKRAHDPHYNVILHPMVGLTRFGWGTTQIWTWTCGNSQPTNLSIQVHHFQVLC